jgi:hypothetical protein
VESSVSPIIRCMHCSTMRHPISKSLFAFRSTLQADCLYHNDTFAFINRAGGNIVGLIRLCKGRCQTTA